MRREVCASESAALARLAELGEEALAAARSARTPVLVGRLTRAIDRSQLVVARIELRRPGGEACGIDVRADGTVLPFVGRWRRRALANPGTLAAALAALAERAGLDAPH